MPLPTVLRLLGGFDLLWHGERVFSPPGVERVIAYIALHRGPASRCHVAGTLWIDAPEDRAMANLRSALWRLHSRGLAIIEARGDHLALAEEVQVDVAELSTDARNWLDGTVPTDPSRIDHLATATDLLNDWYDDWVLVERERFRQLRLQTLERLALLLLEAGQFGRAAELALAAVASEPLRESSHRALISVHLAQGNRVEATRQYCLYRQLLRDELDLEPSRQMEELVGPVAPALVQRVTWPTTVR